MHSLKIILLIGAVAAFMSSTCDGSDHSPYYSVALEVTNDTENPIEILRWRTFDGSILRPGIFEADYFPDLIRLRPHQTLRFDDVTSYNDEYDEPKRNVQVLVFEEHTLHDYSRREIVENDIYDGYFFFGQKDVQRSKKDNKFVAKYTGIKDL